MVFHIFSAIFFSTWIVLIALVGPLSLFFYARRALYLKIEPLFSRYPKLAILSNIFGLLAIIYYSLIYLIGTKPPCQFSLQWNLILVVIILNSILVRAIYLFISIQSAKTIAYQRNELINKNTLSFSDSEKYRSNESKCKIQQRRKSLKKKRIILISPKLLFTSIIFLIYLIESSVKPSNYHESGCFTYGKFYISNWALRVYSIYYVLSYSVIGILLRKSNDAFGIKTELNLSALFGIIFFSLLTIFSIVPALVRMNEKYFLTVIFGEMLFITFFISSIIVPLYWSYSEERHSIEEEKDEAENHLEDFLKEMGHPIHFKKCSEILNNPQGRKNFGEYLQMEFSVQHLHFWEDSEKLLKLIKSIYIDNKLFNQKFVEITNLASKMYDKYIPQNMDSVINIGQSLCDRFTNINSIIQKLDDMQDNCENSQLLLSIEELYIYAQKDVYRMLRNSYRRYKRTKIYAKMCAPQLSIEMCD